MFFLGGDLYIIVKNIIFFTKDYHLDYRNITIFFISEEWILFYFWLMKMNIINNWILYWYLSLKNCENNYLTQINCLKKLKLK